MASRWMRKAETPRNPALPQDPVSRQLVTAVQDLRYGQLLKTLANGEDDSTMQAIMKPLLEEVAGRLRQEFAAGRNPKQEDTNAMLADHLKQRLTMKQLEALDRDSGTQGSPKDIMAFAEGAVNIQKAAADTALAAADRERQLRLEAEQNAGANAEYARQEEQQKANQQIELMDKMYQNMMAMTEKMADQRFQFAETLHQSALASIQKQAEDAIARISGSTQEAMATKEQLHEREKEILKLQFGHELEKHKIAMPLDKDPQYLHQMNYVYHNRRLQDAELAKLEKETESKLKTDETIRESIPQIIQTVRELTSGGLSFANPFAGGGDQTEGEPAESPGLGGV